MLEVNEETGDENIDNLPAELFITVYSDEHRDLLLHTELGGDGELPGDDGDGEHLADGDRPDRVVASGEPVGHKGMNWTLEVDKFLYLYFLTLLSTG